MRQGIVHLRNILTVPPGGFRYTQHTPDGAVMKSWATMNDAWGLAVTIADFRKGNGLERATPKEALADIEEATCQRLHGDPAHCVDEAKKKGLRAALSRLSTNAGHAADGARILVQWLGTGAESVAVPVAQARANVCLTCDRNKLGHRWLKLTSGIVRAIAEEMRAKDERKLRVENEDKLGVCSECDCIIPLKIWLKRDILAERTSQEVLNALPAWCWLKAELHGDSI